MSQRRKKTATIAAALTLWAIATTCGLAVLCDYSATPGLTYAAPPLWPPRSAIPAPSNRPTLVLFLHPKCPCSRATVAELAEIMARVGDQISVTVLMLQPETEAGEWANTRLAQSVAAIPHLAVRPDRNGTEASLFRATTSGEAYVYDASGRLQFHGGITGARGHIGDNAGRQAVQSLVLCSASDIATTSAFGCPLHSPTTSNQRPLSQP